jgi:hypothetical protein
MPENIVDNQGRPFTNILTPVPFEKITGSGSNLESSVLSATAAVPARIYAKADCYYKIGLNPAADNTANPLNAGQFEYVKVPANHKISVEITGDFHIAEMI